ncbi:hypothetical protein pEaSNUABM22_00284 [Erwinia phage pEa_SNUABM_22]|uniref:Uncharacterized protein n=1 Tax=Erwinia phage pEa_SNUABM_22 TaxID=2869549 RepID=A0AAE8XS22_9CAUD|nr:hypothetical protein MPK63_gp283 [Erwinia phage pEa_SNUABM_22]UAW96771.1 hypothetical protein pEaSNUABM22_00284 [Erwinia phage pEa_SNUABM_22]
MLRKLWVAMGFIFPTVKDALNSGEHCTRIGYRNYCIRSAGGFAEAFSDHLIQYRSSSMSLAQNEDRHEDVLNKARHLEYPCVIYFNDNTFNSIPVEEPRLRYPTP